MTTTSGPIPTGEPPPTVPRRVAGRRGLVLVAGFWLVVAGLIGTRVVLFDEIAAAGLRGWAAGQIARLSPTLLR